MQNVSLEAGGNGATALGYVNAHVQEQTVQLYKCRRFNYNFILTRELENWEGHRRTDLVRFGKFTGGSYLWPWKVEFGAQHNLSEIYSYSSCSTIFKF
jgi:hypothetical protein